MCKKPSLNHLINQCKDIAKDTSLSQSDREENICTTIIVSEGAYDANKVRKRVLNRLKKENIDVSTAELWNSERDKE